MTTVVPELRRARATTFTLFVLNGFVLGLWVVHIPVIAERAGVGTTMLGGLLLVLGGGAFAGMQLGGRLSDRVGSGRTALASGVAMSIAVIGPSLTDTATTLGVALGVLGACNGVMDVSMNAHAVEVERGYRRPIMGAFHAYYSAGGLLAALVGGLLIAAGVDVVRTFAAATTAGVVVVVVCARGVLRPGPRAAPAPAGTATGRRGWGRRVLGLAVLAFALMLAEGVAGDWSTIHLSVSLGTSKATAWAYGLFSATMTIGRLVTDAVVARVGSAAFVRGGALLAAAGLALAALAPVPAVALVGWAVFGAGLSGCVPQFFSAAGNVGTDASGTNLAKVAGLGYVGLLAGPALIGGLTHWVSLATAFWLPVAGCVVTAWYVPRLLRPAADRSAAA